MNTKNFSFLRTENGIYNDEAYEDYWFKVSGVSKKEIEDRVNEMCMVAVTEVAYCKVEDIVVAKRIFPFNYNIVRVDDENLKKILKEIVYGSLA